MPELLGNVRFWIEHQTYPADEIAVRLHHGLTQIHGFPNGNGRHAREMADLLIERLGGEAFTWAIGAIPIILAEADSPVSADFNNKPLGEIDIDSSSAYYVIRLSPQARTVRISGAYKDALCDADLLNRICRNNDDKLSCVDDPAQKTLRICAKADEAACRNRTL
jgi:hypothetical protein